MHKSVNATRLKFSSCREGKAEEEERIKRQSEAWQSLALFTRQTAMNRVANASIRPGEKGLHGYDGEHS